MSRAETNQFTLLQLLPATVSSRHESLVQTGQERVTTNEIKCELEQKEGGEGAADLLSQESNATTSLIFKCC